VLVGPSTRLIDVQPFNDALVAQGYEAVSGLRGGLSVVLGVEIERFVMEVDIDWTAGDEEPRVREGESPSRVPTGTQLGAVTGMISVGYSILSSRRHRLGGLRAGFDLFPLVGFGGSTIMVEVRDGAPRDAATFDQQLGAPYDNATLTRDTLGLSFGGGLDFTLGEPLDDEGLEVGAVLGMRAGYHSDVYGDGWYVYQQPLAGGPDLNLSGPYMKLLLGFYYGGR
jgi:hypothetical protein